MTKPSRAPSTSTEMLVRVAEQIRGATSLHALAACVISELATTPGIGGSALVLCDADGAPSLWIGDTSIDRETAQAYLDSAYRHDACFARARATYLPQAAEALWVGPLIGGDGVIGMLRVIVEPAVDRGSLTTIAAYISIRIAILGLAVDDATAIATLTRRQREVAELVAHGCTNAEIAKMLRISANAVKKHVSRVLTALDVSNRTELAAVTGRWRPPSEIDQVLPPTLHVVVRNPPKPAPGGEPDDGA